MVWEIPLIYQYKQVINRFFFLSCLSNVNLYPLGYITFLLMKFHQRDPMRKKAHTKKIDCSQNKQLWPLSSGESRVGRGQQSWYVWLTDKLGAIHLSTEEQLLYTEVEASQEPASDTAVIFSTLRELHRQFSLQLTLSVSSEYFFFNWE